MLSLLDLRESRPKNTVLLLLALFAWSVPTRCDSTKVAWSITGNRSEGWHTMRITDDPGLALSSSRAFGSSFSPDGSSLASCTVSQAQGATFPMLALPTTATPSSNGGALITVVFALGPTPPSTDAALLSSGGQNGLLLTTGGMSLSLSSNQGECGHVNCEL